MDETIRIPNDKVFTICEKHGVEYSTRIECPMCHWLKQDTIRFCEMHYIYYHTLIFKDCPMCIPQSSPSFSSVPTHIEPYKRCRHHDILYHSKECPICVQSGGHSLNSSNISTSSKPPLGVKPKRIYIEDRIENLTDAISRYVDVYVIGERLEGDKLNKLEEWINELSEKIFEIKQFINDKDDK